MTLTQWDCPLCGARGNLGDTCIAAGCGAKLVTRYTDSQAVEDGVLIDLYRVAQGRMLPRAPNKLFVNRCTSAVFCAFSHTSGDELQDRRLWQAISASMRTEDGDWFKGNFEGKELWLIPNEVGGMTLMFPSDY